MSYIESGLDSEFLLCLLSLFGRNLVIFIARDDRDFIIYFSNYHTTKIFFLLFGQRTHPGKEKQRRKKKGGGEITISIALLLPSPSPKKRLKNSGLKRGGEGGGGKLKNIKKH